MKIYRVLAFSLRIVSVLLLTAGLSMGSFISAQIPERVFKTDYRINPEKKGELLFELDNLSFFKDNEFAGHFMKGYTLPGLWVQPKVVYYPLKNLKLEAGVHMLRYWGANRYPNMAYQDIAFWKGDQYQKGFHVLPFFRAQVALSEHVDIILGNIYGGSNHNLIEPLYFPELNLTADPEMGLQLLYTSRFLDLDAWVNWESFIFKESTHQEAFVFGLSNRLKFNDPEAIVHYYMPVQMMAQHRGGELDHEEEPNKNGSVQTLMNGAIGVGAQWNTGRPVFKNVNLEIDALGYAQQAGTLWPLDNGYGVYARASADIYDFRVKTSYSKSYDFISMFGVPFFGSASTKSPGSVFDNPDYVYLGVEYSRELAKGFSLGIDMDVYQQFATTMREPEKEPAAIGSATYFSAGIYLRINPSFLIKKF